MDPCPSQKVVADKNLVEVWDRTQPFPSHEHMRDLDAITHVTIERARADGYHYLHEPTIAAHHGSLFLGWANHRQAEFNVCGEVVRGARSDDGGLTWSAPEIWAAPPANGSNSYNQPVLLAHRDRLWGFFTRWDGTVTEEELLGQGLGCCNPPGVGPQPATEVFLYDDDARRWESTGAVIPGFLPFQPPMRLRDGNWIIGGELFWYEAAVAVSEGDDLTRWQTVRIPRPDDMGLLFPETALLAFEDRILAVLRPRSMQSAPVAESRDGGLTWTTLRLSNFPLAESQPCAGRLSTGQSFLITCNLEEGRHLLSIALTDPGGSLFRHVRKIRHQAFPRRRHFPGYAAKGKIDGNMLGATTEWSYPGAVEYDGKLYVAITQGKEDCVLSIVPVSVLEATGREA